ncbi:hypothetical protein [Streptococcus anginosus]|nr:hypothetical protein [Streptococcus anginosus]BBD43237.1 hypothetical protein SA27298_1785 [Streptococcus anginosus]
MTDKVKIENLAMNARIQDRFIFFTQAVARVQISKTDLNDVFE